MEDTNQYQEQGISRVRENQMAVLNRISRVLGHLEKVKEMMEGGED